MAKMTDLLQLMHDGPNRVNNIKSLVELAKKHPGELNDILEKINQSADELNKVFDTYYTTKRNHETL